MDFIGVEKYFAPEELIDKVKFFGNSGSGVFELCSGDHFGKRDYYDFIFLGTYVGDTYGEYGDEWVYINDYFDQEEIVEKLFAKYKVRPLPRVKMKLITGNKRELHIVYSATEF